MGTKNLMIALLVGVAGLRAETLTVQPAPGSRFGLEVFKTGLMSGKKHDFTFSKYAGTVDFNKARPAESKVNFTIEGASIQCSDDWSPAKGSLDKIVAWAMDEMMEVKKHPQLKFVSTSVQPTGANQYDVAGTLTVRGIAKPALVKVKTTEMGKQLIVDGTSVVDLKDYGLKGPKAGLGTVGTKEAMTVTFSLKAQ